MLYPFSERAFDGLAWNTPWFMVFNHLAIAAPWPRWTGPTPVSGKAVVPGPVLSRVGGATERRRRRACVSSTT